MTTLNGFSQFGNGPHKVFVLNGWFGSSADWSALTPALDPDRFSYAFFDYRGYGLSRDIRGAFTFDEVASDVLALADHLDWRRFSLVGHSMGGMAMQCVLLAAPERIVKMAGISAVPACGSRMDEARLAMFPPQSTTWRSAQASFTFRRVAGLLRDGARTSRSNRSASRGAKRSQRICRIGQRAISPRRWRASRRRSSSS